MTLPEKLDRGEAIRYLGGAGIELTDEMNALIDDCERELLSVIAPKYRCITVALPCEEIMRGEDIRRHLEGCDRAVMLCATLGAQADRLIRVAQVSDMARAVVLDSLASVAIEQVCRMIDEMIAAENPGEYLTFRFSPGYGDYPIELQKTFLTMLDAPRRIGLSMNESCLLIPAKSVTAVAGLSKEPIPKRKRGCAVCSLKNTCRYRRNGEHCGF